MVVRAALVGVLRIHLTPHVREVGKVTATCAFCRGDTELPYERLDRKGQCGAPTLRASNVSLWGERCSLKDVPVNTASCETQGLPVT